MPAQKRSASDALLDQNPQQQEITEPSQTQRDGDDDDAKTEERDADNNDNDDEVEEDEQQDSEENNNSNSSSSNSSSSSSSSSSSEEEKPEFVYVELSEIRKDVQCPICLGIIKKTRTVMECLHRFCRECIDKSMRLGNNECPACRTHCASRRSLRDDPNYDALIAALYPDIDKYEEEELAFHEEERNRNKQIQASIAQVLQKQSEALVKRRSLGKDASGGFMTRSQRNLRNSRRRRSCRGTEIQASEDNEDENNGGKDSSSNDERCTDVKPRKYKRRIGRPSHASSSAAKSEGGCSGNDSEVKRENRGISPSLVWSPEMLAWGGGGARSHTRHGNNSGSNSKSSRSARVSKLVDHLRSLNENSDEVDVKVLLISDNEQNMSGLQQPYIYCQANLPVKHLCEYVAHHTPLESEEVEMLMVKTPTEYTSLENGMNSFPAVDLSNSELLKLEEQETLAVIRATSNLSRDHLVLAYRRKETTH